MVAPCLTVYYARQTANDSKIIACGRASGKVRSRRRGRAGQGPASGAAPRLRWAGRRVADTLCEHTPHGHAHGSLPASAPRARTRRASEAAARTAPGTRRWPTDRHRNSACHIDTRHTPLRARVSDPRPHTWRRHRHEKRSPVLEYMRSRLVASQCSCYPPARVCDSHGLATLSLLLRPSEQLVAYRLELSHGCHHLLVHRSRGVRGL